MSQNEIEVSRGVSLRWLDYTDEVHGVDLNELARQVATNGEWINVTFCYYSSKTDDVVYVDYQVKWVKNAENEKVTVSHQSAVKSLKAFFGLKENLPSLIEINVNDRISQYRKLSSEVQEPKSTALFSPFKISFSQINHISQVEPVLPENTVPVFIFDLDNTLIGLKVDARGRVKYCDILSPKNMTSILEKLKSKYLNAKILVLTNSEYEQAIVAITRGLKVNESDFFYVDSRNNSCYQKVMEVEGKNTYVLTDKFRRLDGIFKYFKELNKCNYFVFVDDQRSHIREAAEFAHFSKMGCHLYEIMSTKENAEGIARAHLLQRLRNDH
ncbi:hypothetical protein SOPP22_01050 [Shewanella sp. OPT22]|nr:hypothetical protein SOPP22_01050 [Shewanella sp. OPT22]